MFIDIQARTYPLGAHFVHANEGGDLAVVAVMYKQGIPNQACKKELDKTHGKAGVEYHRRSSIVA